MANQSRQKILDAASSLLERQGYHATGLNQIVEESNTPRGSLYYYFPDGKEELVSEAVNQNARMAVEGTRQFLSQTEDPAEAIYSMISQAAQMMTAHGCQRGAPIAVVALEASNTNERIRKACAEGYQALQEVLKAKLVMGGYSAENATALAVTINSAMEGAMVLSRAQQSAESLQHVASQMKRLIEMTPKG